MLITEHQSVSSRVYQSLTIKHAFQPSGNLCVLKQVVNMPLLFCAFHFPSYLAKPAISSLFSVWTFQKGLIFYAWTFPFSDEERLNASLSSTYCKAAAVRVWGGRRERNSLYWPGEKFRFPPAMLHFAKKNQSERPRGTAHLHAGEQIWNHLQKDAGGFHFSEWYVTHSSFFLELFPFPHFADLQPGSEINMEKYSLV